MFLLLFELVVTYFWFSISAEQEKLYGIVILVENDSIFKAVNYTYDLSNIIAQKEMKYEQHNYNYANGNHRELIKTITKSEEWKNIPTNKIFLRIFYSLEFSKNQKKDYMDQLLDFDKKLARNYLKFPNVLPVGIMTFEISNLLTFALINIDLQEERIYERVILCYDRETLFVGFLTSSPQAFPNDFITEIEYHSNKYFVFAHHLKCAQPSTVNLLIYKKLIEDSKGSQEITHPCMPTNYYFIFDADVHINICLKNFGIKYNVKFVGKFDQEKCTELIKHSIFQNGLEFEPPNKVNFAGLHLPLQLDPMVIFGLYNDHLHTKTGKIVLETEIEQEIIKTCEGGKNLKEVTYTYSECLENVYLIYILYDILNLHGSGSIYDNFQIVDSTEKLIFSDPRVGPLIVNAYVSSSIYSDEQHNLKKDYNIDGMFWAYITSLLAFAAIIVFVIYLWIRKPGRRNL